MHRTIMGRKGQITVPAELRKKLKLQPGAHLHWSEENGRLVLVTTKRLLDGIRGFLKPGPGEPSAFDASFEERRRARNREDS